MHPEYENRVTEQNRLLAVMLNLDRDAEDFDEQFDVVAAELMAVTRELDRLVQTDPSIRCVLAL